MRRKMVKRIIVAVVGMAMIFSVYAAVCVPCLLCVYASDGSGIVVVEAPSDEPAEVDDTDTGTAPLPNAVPSVKEETGDSSGTSGSEDTRRVDGLFEFMNNYDPASAAENTDAAGSAVVTPAVCASSAGTAAEKTSDTVNSVPEDISDAVIASSDEKDYNKNETTDKEDARTADAKDAKEARDTDNGKTVKIGDEQVPLSSDAASESGTTVVADSAVPKAAESGFSMIAVTVTSLGSVLVLILAVFFISRRRQER